LKVNADNGVVAVVVHESTFTDLSRVFDAVAPRERGCRRRACGSRGRNARVAHHRAEAIVVCGSKSIGAKPIQVDAFVWVPLAIALKRCGGADSRRC